MPGFFDLREEQSAICTERTPGDEFPSIDGNHGAAFWRALRFGCGTVRVHCVKVCERRAGRELTAMNRVIGLAIIIGGLCLVFAGLLIYTGWLSWFGRLPGDVRYESEHVRVYVPIVSMLLLSLALSLLFYLLRRFF